jgi:hypothetical protein
MVLSALLAWGMGATYDHWDASGRAGFEPIGASLIGGILSAILFLVLGVKAATAEYGSGMIRLTLTATPQRWRLLAAKAVIFVPPSLGGLLPAWVQDHILRVPARRRRRRDLARASGGGARRPVSRRRRGRRRRVAGDLPRRGVGRARAPGRINRLTATASFRPRTG